VIRATCLVVFLSRPSGVLPNRPGAHNLTVMEWIEVNIAKDWLSVADICEYMDVSTFVVTSVLRSGKLPAVKFGREWRVSRRDFEIWINEERAQSSGIEELQQ
jgi:excisionase family DNA binding protein